MRNPQPKVLIAGMTSWYLGNTARELEKTGNLGGYWVSNSNRSGVTADNYRRIWSYYLAQKPFYHLPFSDLEEKMRWWNLPFYDAWMSRQTLPPDVSVVQGPMGSCKALFDLADRSGNRILKVFDAPNSHPTSQFGYWQRECDLYAPGYRIPIPQWVRSRMNCEIERADLILCPSHFVRDTMVTNGIPEQKCFVSHFGVDTTVFKKRASIPQKPRFISVGSLTVRKGQQYLLRAFEKVKAVLPESELVCVGGVRADFEPEMKQWKGSFTHYPSISHEELALLLAESTAFVLPSLEEGFARVLSEAMAAGLPILASYESGATTVVQDGVEGIVFRPRDIDAIAEAMIRVARDLVENTAMGNAAYLAGAENNTWTDYAGRLRDEYSKRIALSTALRI